MTDFSIFGFGRALLFHGVLGGSVKFEGWIGAEQGIVTCTNDVFDDDEIAAEHFRRQEGWKQLQSQ